MYICMYTSKLKKMLISKENRDQRMQGLIASIGRNVQDTKVKQA